MCPLYDVPLTDMSRPYVAYRRWVITSTATYRISGGFVHPTRHMDRIKTPGFQPDPPVLARPKLSRHNVRLSPVWDKSYGETSCKGRIVHRTERPRNFVRGHIGRGQSDILPLQLRRENGKKKVCILFIWRKMNRANSF
jgi:hypothetical protein